MNVILGTIYNFILITPPYFKDAEKPIKETASIFINYYSFSDSENMKTNFKLFQHLVIVKNKVFP